MRILLATDAWEPQVNGVVRTLTRIVAELREMGHEVEVISPDQFSTFPLPTYPEIKLAVGAYERVQERFKSFEPEAIHIATEGPIGLAARRICVEWKLPFTTSYHTRFPEYVSARLPLPLAAGYAYMRWFHRPSGRLMVATPTMREELDRHGFRNLSHWSRGVDTELFHPRRRGNPDVYAGMKRPIFLNVGRVAVEKNIEAFVCLDLPGTKVVVGDGPQREELKEKYPNVVFAGAKFGEELAAYFAGADVFVFPSLTDTFGLVLLEAMASGTPVAAFSAPGPIDLVPNSGAGVLAPGQGGGLKEACLEALKLDRETVRRFAERFSWRACAEEFQRNLEPYPEPQKSRFWRRLRRMARLRRGPRPLEPTL
jgi:glycosyltransferase involved in cell wall biosynthesis